MVDHCSASLSDLPALSSGHRDFTTRTSSEWAVYSWPSHPSTLTVGMRYKHLIQQVRIHVESLCNPECSKSHDTTCVQPNSFSSSLTFGVFTLERVFNYLVNLCAVLQAVLSIPSGAGRWKT